MRRRLAWPFALLFLCVTLTEAASTLKARGSSNLRSELPPPWTLISDVSQMKRRLESVDPEVVSFLELESVQAKRQVAARKLTPTQATQLVQNHESDDEHFMMAEIASAASPSSSSHHFSVDSPRFTEKRPLLWTRSRTYDPRVWTPYPYNALYSPNFDLNVPYPYVPYQSVPLPFPRRGDPRVSVKLVDDNEEDDDDEVEDMMRPPFRVGRPGRGKKKEGKNLIRMPSPRVDANEDARAPRKKLVIKTASTAYAYEPLPPQPLFPHMPRLPPVPPLRAYASYVPPPPYIEPKAYELNPPIGHNFYKDRY